MRKVAIVLMMMGLTACGGSGGESTRVEVAILRVARHLKTCRSVAPALNA